MNRIERLSLYKSSSGKTYPDDAATIRLWADRDKDRQPVDKDDDDEDTKQREQMLDDSYNEAMEDIWRAVEAQNEGKEGDDDTEIFLDHENGLTVVGCEHCIDSYSARELNDKGVTDFIELKYDPFMRQMQRVNRDDM